MTTEPTTRPHRTVLLTGFEPFGGDLTNPSWDAAVQVSERWQEESDGARLVIARLPVVFRGLRERLAALIATHRPDVIVCAGLAAGRPSLSLERVAINLADARIADNDAWQPVDEPVREGGPEALFSSVPVKAAVTAARTAEAPVAESLSAGSFVCNAAMYHALDLTSESGARAGFVHVPRAIEDGDAAVGLPLPVIARSLHLVLRAYLGHQGPDLRIIGGATH